MLQTLDREAQEWLRQHESELPAISNFDPFLTMVRNAVRRVKPGKNQDKKIQSVLESFDGLLSASGQDSVLSGIIADFSEPLQAYFRYTIDHEKCSAIAQTIMVFTKHGPRPATPGEVRSWINKIETWLTSLSKDLGLTLIQKAKLLSELRTGIEQLKKDAAWSQVSRLLPSVQDFSSEPDVDPSKMRGAEWATAKNIRLEPEQPRLSLPPEAHERFKQLLSERHVETTPIPQFVGFPAIDPRYLDRDSAEYRYLASLFPQSLDSKGELAWGPEVWSTVCRILGHDLAPQRPIPALSSAQRRDAGIVLEWKRELSKAPVALSASKRRARELDACYLAALDDAKLPRKTREQFRIIADCALDGKSVSETAKRLKLSPRKVNTLIKQLRTYKPTAPHNA